MCSSSSIILKMASGFLHSLLTTTKVPMVALVHWSTSSPVSVGMRTKDLTCFTRQVTLEQPTDRTDDLHRIACELVRQNYSWSTPMRSIGITVSGLTTVSHGIQSDFFTDPVRRMKREKLEAVSDSLKRRFGNQCLLPATLLVDRELTGFDPRKDHIIHPEGWF